jgi:SAM-dependent methyltransferase
VTGTPDFAHSFGAVAASYSRIRPSYPPGALDFVLAGLRPRRLLDLGAGTGKLTASLIKRADEVLAVDPDPSMLDQLRQELPQVTARLGSAEQIEAEDRSIDAILIGQAFHWFSRPEADREMARVLRRGGVAGLLWNFPDTDVGWVSELYDCTNATRPIFQPQADLDPDLFDTPETRWFPNGHVLAGPLALLELVHTWSWVICRPEQERAEVDLAVQGVLGRHDALRQPVITLPQRTKAVRQYRR